MHAWQNPELTRRFLTGIRAALPLVAEQLDVMLYVIDRAIPDPRQIERILDVGSGSGALSRVLLERYPHAHAILVDFSEPMLEAARAHFTPQQATLYNCDLTQPEHWLPSAQAHATYDVIVSGYAIHHLTDARKQTLYQEIFDLLRPGGVFINVEHVASPDAWVEDLFNQSVTDAIYANPELNEGMSREAIHARMSNQEDGDICAPVETQCDWLREVGFQHVDCYMKIYALAVFGGIKPENES